MSNRSRSVRGPPFFPALYRGMFPCCRAREDPVDTWNGKVALVARAVSFSPPSLRGYVCPIFVL